MTCLAVPAAAQSSMTMVGQEPPAFRLAGSEQVAYIVLPSRQDNKAVFDVLRRRTGEGWKRVTAAPITGTPMLTAVVGGDLHVFFSPLQYGVLKSDGSAVSMRADPSAPVPGGSGVVWPAGARPRAACEAVGFAGVSSPTLLAVVPLPGGWGGEGIVNHKVAPPRVPGNAGHAEDTDDADDAGTDDAAQSESEDSADSEPSTAPVPATQPGAAVREELALFQLVESRWVFRGHVTATPVGRDTRVHVAAVDGTAYVLVDHGRRGKGLWAVHPNTPARAIELPEATRDSRTLALLGMDKTLMLLTAVEEAEETPAAEGTETFPADGPDFHPTAGQWAARIWFFDGDTFDHNRVHTATGPMTWSPTELPQAARWGDYIQLAWGQRDTLRSARLDPSGLMTAPADIDAMSQSNPQAAMEVHHWFMMGVMAAVILLTLFAKPSGPPRPFLLPPHMQPGRLGRRLIATMLDVLPCQAIGLKIAGWDEAVEGLQAIAHHMQPTAGNSAAYVAMMVTMSLLLLYGTLAEWKLGTTFGKRLMGLCVIGDEGKPVTFRAVALRNAMKLLELFWVMLPLALIFAVITRYRQRLGDVFARTTVIDRATLEAPPTLPVEENDDAGTR